MQTLKPTLRSRVLRVVAVPGSALLASAAHAQVAAPDVSAVVTYIESLWSPIVAVAGAMLVIHFGIRGYRMLRGV